MITFDSVCILFLDLINLFNILFTNLLSELVRNQILFDGIVNVVCSVYILVVLFGLLLSLLARGGMHFAFQVVDQVARDPAYFVQAYLRVVDAGVQIHVV